MKKVFLILSVVLISLLSSCVDEKELNLITSSTDQMTFNPQGVSQTLTITAKLNCKLKSSATWCSLSDSIGTGSKIITVECSRNILGQSRSANIYIDNGKEIKTITVLQSGGQVLFEDYYDNNTKSWPVKNDSLISTISNGVYNISNRCITSSYLVTKSLVTNYTGNYMIKLKYSSIAGNLPFGLLFGSKDAGNYYRILIYPTQTYYSVSKKLDNVTTAITSGYSTAISAINTLSMVRIGSNCEVYINDVKICTFDYTAPFGSYVGYYSCPQTEISVDYIKVMQF